MAQLQTNDENGVSLVLYDTSSDEDDVNINQVLINKLSGFPEGHAMNAFGPGGDQAQPPDAMPPLELPSGNVSGTKRMLSTLLTYLILFFCPVCVGCNSRVVSARWGYGDLGYSGRTGYSDRTVYSDLNPRDGGQSLCPMCTVSVKDAKQLNSVGAKGFSTQQTCS